jgi:hypothetical protein
VAHQHRHHHHRQFQTFDQRSGSIFTATRHGRALQWLLCQNQRSLLHR